LGGDIAHSYLIIKTGKTLIGLFQSLFRGNILTFNHGWDENAQLSEKFDDVNPILKEP